MSNEPTKDEDEAAAKPAAPKPDQVFVVQMEDGAENGRWADIATVSIPANTPRRIALKQALEGMAPGKDAPRLRALDKASAEVHEPEAHQPPVEWRL